MSVVKITPPKGLIKLDISELWQYRELLGVLVWRDVKIRYKQTLLGVSWAVIQPVVSMVVFSMLFGNFFQEATPGKPYAVVVFAGLIFWNYFSAALTGASGSLLANEAIISKVYFPRLIIPLAACMSPLLDLVISFSIFLGLIVYFNIDFPWIGLTLTPILLAVTFLAAIGAGVGLAAVNVKYRDVRYALPFAIQILMFITPVIYPVSFVSEKMQWLLLINPMAGVITMARFLFLGERIGINLFYFGLPIITGIGLLILGLAYFRKTERFFADII
jgi:lipopolysaccharide transport system permease protein